MITVLCVNGSPDGCGRPFEKRLAYKVVEAPAELKPFDPERPYRAQPDERLLRLGEGMTEEDIEQLKAEIRRYGDRHVRRFLEQTGLAVAVRSERFNRCGRLDNVVDFQFDHPGVLAIGTRITYEVPLIGITYAVEVG